MPEYLFIYDHTILQGKEDSNYDPTEAILYFYPPSTSLDYQHSLCSHVMGFCQILSNLFQSSPKLFDLDSGAKIACIHEPYLGLVKKSESRVITFALYSEDIYVTHLFEKCTLIYESFIFYLKKCLACIFNKIKSKSKYVNNIISRLMILINHRDKLSSIFNASLFCNSNDETCNRIEALVYQTVIGTVDSVQREAEDFNVSVLGGCLFYNKCLILNQFSADIVNLFSLLIDCLNNDSGKGGKEMFNFIKRIQINTENLQTRDGVFIFQVCVTQKRYREILDFSKFPAKHDTKSCCDSKYFHYLHVYLEHHSNMTILFLIDEPDFRNINRKLLKIFSNLCFKTLGDIEANIATTTSTADDKNEVKGASTNLNQWNINYDEHDRSFSVTNSLNGANIATNWEECLLKRVNALHENLENESSIKEINAKVKKENFSAMRFGGHQTFTMKSSN